MVVYHVSNCIRQKVVKERGDNTILRLGHSSRYPDFSRPVGESTKSSGLIHHQQLWLHHRARLRYSTCVFECSVDNIGSEGLLTHHISSRVVRGFIMIRHFSQLVRREILL